MILDMMKSLATNERASLSPTLALAIVPLTLAAGIAIDYSRSVRAAGQAQSALDAAVLTALKDNADLVAAEPGSSISADAQARIVKGIQDTFEANAPSAAARGHLENTITRAASGAVNVTSVFNGSIGTTLTQVLGYSSMPYSVSSQATVGGSRKYVDYVFIVDASGSMSIGSTQQMMDAMEASPMQCSFACHLSGADVTAKQLGFETKFDVVKSGISGIVSTFMSMNLTNNSVSVGVQLFSNRLGNDQYNTGSFDNTRDLAISKQNIEKITMHSVNGGTNFRESLKDIPDWIGKSGDGSSAAKAQKVVILVTDGVADDIWFTGPPKPYPDSWWPSRDWNFVPESIYVKAYSPMNAKDPPSSANSGWYEGFSPFNSQYCDKFKQNGNKVYVVQASYYIPTNMYDKRYDAIKTSILSKATDELKACATSSETYFKADDRQALVDAFGKLGRSEAGNLRLSQ